MKIWDTFEKDWQAYQSGILSEKELNASYAKTEIQKSLLDSVLAGVAREGDTNLFDKYGQELPWLDVTVSDSDYQNISSTMSKGSDSRSETVRHLYYGALKANIEKTLKDLERGYPLATAPVRGPGLYTRNYFAQKNLSGYLLPVILIAYFLMNAMELYRSRSIFYSRSLPISPLRFWAIQLLSVCLVALGLFLLTFLLGFLASGLCFGWTDLQELVPFEPDLWKTGFGAAADFASNTMNSPFFSTTLKEAPYYPSSISWIPCATWVLIVLILEAWLLFLQGLTVYSLAFLVNRTVCLFGCAIWILAVCLLRYRFTVLSVIPLFWPSVVDTLYGGYGIGWGVWLLCSLMYCLLLLVFDRWHIGKNDIRG